MVRRLASALAALLGRDTDEHRPVDPAKTEGSEARERAGAATIERSEAAERAGEAREPATSTVSQINALYAAARILGSGADLPVIAAQTLEVIQTTTRMDAGTMVRLDRATDTLHLIAHRGIRDEHVEPLRVRRVEESAPARRDPDRALRSRCRCARRRSAAPACAR